MFLSLHSYYQVFLEEQNLRTLQHQSSIATFNILCMNMKGCVNVKIHDQNLVVVEKYNHKGFFYFLAMLTKLF